MSRCPSTSVFPTCCQSLSLVNFPVLSLNQPAKVKATRAMSHHSHFLERPTFPNSAEISKVWLLMLCASLGTKSLQAVRPIHSHDYKGRRSWASGREGGLPRGPLCPPHTRLICIGSITRKEGTRISTFGGRRSLRQSSLSAGVPVAVPAHCTGLLPSAPDHHVPSGCLCIQCCFPGFSAIADGLLIHNPDCPIVPPIAMTHRY